MSLAEDIVSRSHDQLVKKAVERLGVSLVAEMLGVDGAYVLSLDDEINLEIANRSARQIEARYGPSSARLWFDNPNVFLNSGDEIRPIEMLASDDPDRYSKLQCALNIHLGEPLYDQ